MIVKEKKSVQRYYDKEYGGAPDKSRRPPKTIEPIIRRIRKFTPKNGFVLDAGCGSGIFLDEILILNRQVVGIDLSISGLRRCNKKTTGLVLADVENLPFKDSAFSGVISISVIEFTSCPELVFKEFNRVLKTDSILLLTAPNLLSLMFLRRVISLILDLTIFYGSLVKFYNFCSLLRLFRNSGFRTKLFDGFWTYTPLMFLGVLPRWIRCWLGDSLIVLASKT